MKIITYNILIVFALNFKCFSQDLSTKLVGAWEYIGTKHTKHVECEDILIFNLDSTYLILNDCYAFDPIKPIVETGNWKADKKLSQISLINRKISKEYVYQNSKAKLLVLYVKKISDSMMEICFVNKTGCISEIYKKSERKIQ
ncbi:MAG: hypothetical protein JNJ40_05910 [Bacteroidia bacterium]|nr:hypothetical protein [Bacteroidia bacterium]